MQVDPENLRKHYASLSDEALLDVVRAELTKVAQGCLDNELAERHLSSRAVLSQKDGEARTGASAVTVQPVPKRLTRLIKRRILVTLGFLALFEVGGRIPLPYVDAIRLQEFVQVNGVGSYLVLGRERPYLFVSVLSLGLNSYLYAILMLQLAALIITPIERLFRSGVKGAQRLSQLTVFIAGVYAAFGAVTYVSALKSPQDFLENQSFLSLITIVWTLMAGATVVIWIASQISIWGVGSGLEVVILYICLSSIPILISNAVTHVQVGDWNVTSTAVSVLAMTPALVLLVIAEQAFDINRAGVIAIFLARWSIGGFSITASLGQEQTWLARTFSSYSPGQPAYFVSLAVFVFLGWLLMRNWSQRTRDLSRREYMASGVLLALAVTSVELVITGLRIDWVQEHLAPTFFSGLGSGFPGAVLVAGFLIILGIFRRCRSLA